MRILIIGGTGFLGYHASRELAARGHEVTAMGLPPGPPAGLFPDSVQVTLQAMEQLEENALDKLLQGFEAVVFAAGADDRAIPASPAARFFYEANVKSTVRLAAASVRANVKRFVLLGSYFTFLNREWPDKALAEHHPYIESRVHQQELAIAVAGSRMAVICLELPYIFGAMPGVVPLWAPLVSYVRSGVPLYYTEGGSNMVSVNTVAQAIAGACERIDETRIYQVGDENLPWSALLGQLCQLVGRDDDRVHTLPQAGLGKISWVLDALHALKGKESGLHASFFSSVQTAYAYFDNAVSRNDLGYETGGLPTALRDTVNACPEKQGTGYWRKFASRLQRA